eukprot:g42926.t1
MASETQWLYIDDEGLSQGPFPRSDMAAWFTAGYFTAATKVKLASEPASVPFKPVSERTDCDFVEKPAQEQPAPAAEEKGKEQEQSQDVADEVEWMYIDQQGAEQGPFPHEDMADWYEAGFFLPSTMVKKFVKGVVKDATFLPIADRKDCLFAQAEKKKKEEKEGEGKAAHIDVLEEFEVEVDEADIVAAPENKKKFVWYYLDAQGIQQGPWSEKQMAIWHAKGFFRYNNPKVRTHKEDVFILLSRREEVPEWATGDSWWNPAGPKKDTEESKDSKEGKETKAGEGKKEEGVGQKDKEGDKAGQKEGDEKKGTVEVVAPAAALPPPPTDPEQLRWFYLDKDEKVQGPWSTPQMRKWYSAGLLSMTLRVRTEQEKDYVPIGECARPPSFTRPPGDNLQPSDNKAAQTPNTAPSPAHPNPNPAQAGQAPPAGANQPSGQTQMVGGVMVPAGPRARPPPFPVMQPNQAGPMGAGQQGFRVQGNLTFGPGGLVNTGGAGQFPGQPPQAGVPVYGQQQGQPQQPGGGWSGGGMVPPRPQMPGGGGANYAQTAAFNRRGRMEQIVLPGQEVMSHWEKKGLPEDRAGRQMSQYFEFDQWQEEQNRRLKKQKLGDKGS